MAFNQRGGRKVIIAPDGGDAWGPAKPRPDEMLIRALARAHRWKRLLEEGKFRSVADVAEAEKVTRSFVNRLLRLTLLAPDIAEAILDGHQPEGMRLEGDDGDDADRVGRAEALSPCEIGNGILDREPRRRARGHDRGHVSNDTKARRISETRHVRICGGDLDVRLL